MSRIGSLATALPKGTLPFLVATSLATASFALQGRTGLALGGDGYLWYGASRTAAGETPIRDFQSYDPGRYYWVAPWIWAFGDSLLTVRLATAAFGCLGLWLGLTAARRAGCSRFALIPVGCMLLLWMLPQHKIYECSLSIAAVFMAQQLLTHPSGKQFLAAGAFVGLSAFFGRNLALYHFIGVSALIAFLHYRMGATLSRRDWSLYTVGLALGYSPMALLVASVPGFSEAFFESFHYLLFVKDSANITRPIPWPWAPPLPVGQPYVQLSEYFYRTSYLLMPALYGLAIVRAFTTEGDNLRRSALLLAAGFIGIPYLHHLLSRADLPHMAQSIHPFLLGLVGLPAAFAIGRSRVGRGLSVALLTLICAVGFRFGPIYHARTARPSYEDRLIDGDQFSMARHSARLIDDARAAQARWIGTDESLFVAPHYPGLYAVLGITSPVRENYFLRKQTKEAQHRMIRQLEEANTNWALFADQTVDGREDLRFSRTTTILWRYLMDHFEEISFPERSGSLKLYRRVSQLDLNTSPEFEATSGLFHPVAASRQWPSRAHPIAPSRVSLDVAPPRLAMDRRRWERADDRGGGRARPAAAISNPGGSRSSRGACIGCPGAPQPHRTHRRSACASESRE